jgi:hypothetical protein
MHAAELVLVHRWLKTWSRDRVIAADYEPTPWRALQRAAWDALNLPA